MDSQRRLYHLVNRPPQSSQTPTNHLVVLAVAAVFAVALAVVFLNQPKHAWVPHLRDGLIVAKVGTYTVSQPTLAVALAVLFLSTHNHSSHPTNPICE